MTTIEKDQPTANPLADMQSAIAQNMSAIWDNEIKFLSQPAFTWQEGVYHGASHCEVTAEPDVRASEIESRLHALGRDANQVAKSLRKQGITGRRGDPFGCAIARWMQKNFEGYGSIGVGRSIGVGAWCVDLVTTEKTHLRVSTPPAVREFIRMFDGGLYPELVETPVYPIQPSFYKEMMKASAPISFPIPKFVPDLL